MTSAVRLENVGFSYRKNEPILKDININVPSGCIYGFLGANGAGKSTTLRLILSLMKTQAGTISLFEKNIKSSYPSHLKRVGSLIESASLYGHLSATDNLKISSKYFNIGQKIIPSILEKVKLDYVKKKKVKNFSTGMKQRLGLALSLLHDPELLILDEPTNGLDPNGIIELRGILNQLNEEGKTIMLSSHILSEVEKIVDKVGILSGGKIAFEGTLSDLQNLKRKQRRPVKIRVSNATEAISQLQNYECVIINSQQIEVVTENEDAIAKIVKDLTNNNISIYELSPSTKNLESMFLSVTNS